MDDPQELPAKKAKLEADGGQESQLRGLSSGGTPAAALASSEEDGSFSALSAARMDPGEPDQASGARGESDRPIGDAVDSFSHPDGDSAQSDYSQQVYQEASPAVTSFSSQVAFQSAVYSSFPQSGQTYGLPPFGALWPGVKTETGLPEAPPSGQTGFLSFSTAYTSTQPGQLHYSYPSQASSFTTSSVYSNIPSSTAVSGGATAAGPQEFSSYSSLGQNQFSQYYHLPPNYTSATPPSADEHGSGTGAGAVGYSAVKSEEAASAGPPIDASPPENPPAGGARDQDEVGRRNSVGKSKAKAKKSDGSPPASSDLERVFLWDLDETIIIFHSLLTGTYAQKFGKDPATMLNLGLQMEELIFELADTHLFFNDLEVRSNRTSDNQSEPQITTRTSDNQSEPQITTRIDVTQSYFRLGCEAGPGTRTWTRCCRLAAGLLNPIKRELLLRLQSEIENVTDSWLTTALKSLLLIQSRGKCMNVLVTTTQLVPALAKVLLYGLGDVFPIENIYSATKIGKESCFERIVSRFGKKVTYVVIGDGRDEEFAAKQHNMPFWRISTHGDLVSLHQALELDFL
ncbi:protein phosphatase EYA3 [Poecilia reticulata]|uniref:protein phosphatase EYA3 n=1 Tax=Poecilia reticulata TaxID=8081 RepID=UPI0007EB8B9F|nr:PREDICTED: eyes absent homolog 3-like [Poecilia reticulata]